MYRYDFMCIPAYCTVEQVVYSFDHIWKLLKIAMVTAGTLLGNVFRWYP